MLKSTRIDVGAISFLLHARIRKISRNTPFVLLVIAELNPEPLRVMDIHRVTDAASTKPLTMFCDVIT